MNMKYKPLVVGAAMPIGVILAKLASATEFVFTPIAPAEDPDLQEDRMALGALDISGKDGGLTADGGVLDAVHVPAAVPLAGTPDGGANDGGVSAPDAGRVPDDLSRFFGMGRRELKEEPTQPGKGWQGAARLFIDYRIIENLVTGVSQEGHSLNGEVGLGRDWGLGGAGLKLGYGQSRITVEKADAELGESTQHTFWFGPTGYLELAHGKDLETQLYASMQGLIRETKSEKNGLRPRTTNISNDGLEAEVSAALPRVFSEIPRRLSGNKDTDLGMALELYLVFSRETMEDRTSVDYGKQWEGLFNALLTGRYGRLNLGVGAEFARRYTLQLTPDGISQETVGSWNNPSGRVNVRGNRSPHHNAISPLARLELDLGDTWKGGVRGVYGFDGDLKRRELGIYFENPDWQFGVGYGQSHAPGDFKETGLAQGSVQYRGDSSKVLKSIMGPIERILRRQHR